MQPLWNGPAIISAQELAILRVWPFDSYCVDVFNVENQPLPGEPSTLAELKAILAPRGYVHQLRVGVDEIFFRDPPCPAGSALGTHGEHARGRLSKLRPGAGRHADQRSLRKARRMAEHRVADGAHEPE